MTNQANGHVQQEPDRYGIAGEPLSWLRTISIQNK